MVKTSTHIAKLTFFVLLLCLVPSGPSRAATVPLPVSGQFDQITTILAPRLDIRLVESISFKGGKVRVDKTDPSQIVPYSRIQDGLTQYIYIATQQTAIKADLTAVDPPLLDKMKDQTTAMLQGAVKSGTDVIMGYPCDIYKRPTSDGKQQLQFWVCRDPKFPFTLKTILSDPDNGITRTVEIRNINMSAKLDDDFFTFPKGTKVVSASDATGAQGGAAPANAPNTPDGSTVTVGR